MSSCTEDDKGTSPENNNVGASFQFDGEQTWDYEYYSFIENGDDIFKSNLYYLAESDGMLWGKESYIYFQSLESDNRRDGPSVVMSTTEDGLFFKYDYTYSFDGFFPQVKDKWHKFIDYKNESWTQFDLSLDSTTENGIKISATYKLSGSKVKDLEVEYKDEIYPATEYKLELSNSLSPKGPAFNGESKIYNITIIDGIGIYKWEERYGIDIHLYRVLIDHK